MSRSSHSLRAAWLAGAVAAVPAVLACFPGAPAAATSSRQFEPPSDPMVLTRILRRSLPDGAEVLTRRSYEIRFVPEAGGYRVDGKLVDVEVDAPPDLQALAMLERKRPDTGMFPMQLDAQGNFRAQNAAAQSEEVRQASLNVGRAVDTLALKPFDRAQARNFARAFEKRSVRTNWPDDLFHPVPGTHEETRTLPLPNGARGTVRVSIDARTHGASGLLGSLVRRVTTDLEGDSRVTEETWTLTAKS